MDKEKNKELKPGTQILYVPNHAEGDEKHPSVEAGFVTSVRYDGQVAWCRYWSPWGSGKLRTKANSEATPMANIVVKDTAPQEWVDILLQDIEEEWTHGGPPKPI